VAICKVIFVDEILHCTSRNNYANAAAVIETINSQQSFPNAS